MWDQETYTVLKSQKNCIVLTQHALLLISIIPFLQLVHLKTLTYGIHKVHTDMPKYNSYKAIMVMTVRTRCTKKVHICSTLSWFIRIWILRVFLEPTLSSHFNYAYFSRGNLNALYILEISTTLGQVKIGSSTKVTVKPFLR